MFVTTIVKLVAALIALVIMAVSAYNIMVPSYVEYQEYYASVMQEKEYDKYVKNLPLEFVAISAELSEGVEFFEGDLPEKSDFFVKAIFTEKGKEFEKILSPEEFDITIPVDFYANGGLVTISYEFVTAPSEGATEEPKSVIRSCDVNVGMRRNEQLLFTAEAENSSTSFGTQKSVSAYYLNNGKYEELENLTILENFAANDNLKFTFNNEGVAYGDAFIRLANITDSKIDLSDVLEIRVNGRLYPVPVATLGAKEEGKDYVFVDLALPKVVMNGGETELELVFKKDVGLAIDKLWANTVTRGATSDLSAFAKSFGLSIGEYFAMCVDNDGVRKLSTAPAIGSNGKLNTSTEDAIYTMGGVSDGEYLYLSMTTSGNKKAVIYKVDPESYKILAKTEQFTVATASAGNNARVFIKDGSLYCLDSKGELFTIKLSDFNGTCQMTKTDEISFSSLGMALSVVWVESIGRYAVMTTDGKIHLLDETFNAVNDGFEVGIDGFSLASIAADDKFIYVNYTKDGEGMIPIEIYTWEGEMVGSLSAGSFQLFPASGSRSFNVQSIYFHNGQLHVGVCGWGTDSKYYHDWILSVG